MPRKLATATRQRTVFCDCYDCADPTRGEAPAPLTGDALQVAEAMAQQLPPPKALILLGSGLLLPWCA
jgi:hypothetical protein